MKRRTFLQRIGSILTIMGATEAGWLTLGNPYYQALAQPNSRKLALLVGVNQYPQIPALAGCLTDVELQKELLIYRCGFQASDILTLTDEQASREFIETAFLDHLVKQASLGDVVIFHFSGYGTRVNSQNALLTADTVETSQNNKIVNCLLEETLFLLLRSLPTNKVTAILDTSYNAPNPGLAVGLGVRAHKLSYIAQIAAAELDFQTQLKTQDTRLSTILTATSDPKELAREVLFSGFSAGLFTYALTQYLWETTPATTIQFSLNAIASSIQQLGGKQQPALLNGKKNQQLALLFENFLSSNSIGAEGVVTAIEEDGKTVHLWLGGLPPQVLAEYGVNSQFKLVTGDAANVQMIVRSRTGLDAKAQIEGEITTPLFVGQLVQEAVRVIPRNISLTVALDTKLERIERVDATSAFATVSHISTIVAGEQSADYVFSKLPEVKYSEMMVSPSSYALFSLGSELIPNTSGEAGEAVKLAVQRLTPKLRILLAAKFWRLTENEASSRLAVKASLEITNGISPRTVIQRETLRNTLLKISSTQTPTVAIGSRIQYRVQNMSDRPVYLMILGLDSAKNAIALYPWQNSGTSDTSAAKALLTDVVIAPGETRIVPQTTVGFEWLVQGPNLASETQLIISVAPFTQTLARLTAKHPGVQQQRIAPLLNPIEVTQALLQDLHNASTQKTDTNQTGDFYLWDVKNWASFSFIYQVV
ncbi:MAG: caspase family protein [Cyanomargarita calcarea GSE-NOS-MK-12-04C]|uniref:Caspase family protein n=1 Tax=Cyanomargarita calcarea GSE-NOS-MK-12-04C TaxID=2839659 RepID=A0A951QS35_9CYAN|nr:caspase family protein [Cyanomargarita calcarea GSE-NOS-MK-12-04C]